MATNYPGSLDTSTQQPSPSASTEMDDSGFEHDVVHANHSGAIIAVETKIGTGASTPVANSVLGGTGSGTSAWTTTPTLGGLTVDTDTLHVDATNNRVGIGTTSPSVPLHISDDAHAIMRLQNEGSGNTEGPTVELYGNTGRMGLLGFDNSDDIRIKNETSAGKLFFFTNNTVRATVLADGKVGIGTDAPANTFHVNGGTDNFVARFESTDGEAYIGLKDSATSSGGHVAIAAIGDDLVFRAGNNNAARLKSDGKLGIGTSSPSVPLHVATGGADHGILVQSTDSVARVNMQDNSTTDAYAVGVGATGDALSLFAGSAERVTVASDGKVGIATTSPAHPLDVVGEARFSTSVQFNNGGQVIRNWGSGAIDNLLPGSTFGGILEGNSSGHFVIGIRDNDGNDSFSVISGGGDQTTNGYDTVVAYFGANGDVGFGTSSPDGEFELTANTPEMIFSSSPNKTNRYRFDANFTDSADFGFSTSYWDGSAYVRAITLRDSGKVGIGTTSPSTTLDVNGSLSKSSGSFRIPHPLPAKADTHDLVHSFVEAPQADNLYRGRADLTDGAATVDLDAAAGMTTGTFPLLNRDVQCFIVNNNGWTAVRASVSGSTLTIEAQDATCADTVDWLVVGERHDQHMFDTEWTDDDGRVIVEPVRPSAPEDELENA